MSNHRPPRRTDSSSALAALQDTTKACMTPLRDKSSSSDATKRHVLHLTVLRQRAYLLVQPESEPPPARKSATEDVSAGVTRARGSWYKVHANGEREDGTCSKPDGEEGKVVWLAIGDKAI
jgi:hypothetical protein